jgi:hypothetical protein
VGDRHRKLDDEDQRSDNRGPKTDKEQYRDATSNDVWNYRQGKGHARKDDDTGANQQDSREHALEKKTCACPTAGEARKESLQNASDRIVR